MSAPERIGPEAFVGERLARPGVVLVGFLADWCPVCRAFEPELIRFADERSLRLLIADMTSEETPLWDRFGIEIVPTIIVFRDGAQVFRADGAPGVGLGAADLHGAARAAGAPAADRRRRRG